MIQSLYDIFFTMYNTTIGTDIAMAEKMVLRNLAVAVTRYSESVMMRLSSDLEVSR